LYNNSGLDKNILLNFYPPNYDFLFLPQNVVINVQTMSIPKAIDVIRALQPVAACRQSPSVASTITD